MTSPLRLLFNAATLVPGVAALPPIRRYLHGKAIGTGGSDSAEYCYSVWLRHLVTAGRRGLNAHPKVVAELGPGDSLGVGLAALLSGAERYYAFDVVEHASAARNIEVLDALVELFKQRTPIPGDSEFPHIFPKLSDYAFPLDILTVERLDRALAPERVERIRESLRDFASPRSLITYRAPWSGSEVIQSESVDMLFSRAVLKHVDALPETYAAMHAWLAPQGYLSHSVDFKSHGFADEWNGHWEYSDLYWKLVRGKSIWAINREPWSKHVACLNEAGFRLVHQDVQQRPTAIDSNRFARRYRSGPLSDFTTSEVLYLAVKEPSRTATG